MKTAGVIRSFAFALVIASAGADSAPEPFFEGLGSHTRKISTKSSEAQKYFDQGFDFLFGFNHVPDFDMQFNHFLVRDEEPLLFHAGLKGMFPALREAVAKIIDPAKLRHIPWSHFESDEIGALNDWLQLAPQAQPVCTLVGKLVSVDDFSICPARGMTPEDVLTTGKYRYRFYRSPHIPHGWDAGVLFEETG